jgi:hypothetical protein
MGRYLGRRAKMDKQDAARKIIEQKGSCMGITCDCCPGTCRPCGETNDHLAVAREWLASHPEASKPVERFEVGKWYTYPGHNNDKPFQCLSTDGIMARFTNGVQDKSRIDNTWREVPAPTEPAKDSPRRLTVGDRVVIVGLDISGGDSIGQHGEIVKDDSSDFPYLLKSDKGLTGKWYKATSVIPEPPGYTAEAPKTTDPSAEKILAEYYGPFHVQVIKYASGDVKVITPRVGKLSRVQERQRAREARLSRI